MGMNQSYADVCNTLSKMAMSVINMGGSINTIEMSGNLRDQ